MNLPNKLTMLRVILVPVFMVFAAYSRYGTADFNPTFALIAGIIFAVASFTDFLDGYLARKNNLVTDFGKFMDPLADKCLTTAAFIYMVACGICSPVVLAVILFREFAVAGVRMLAAETGTVIAANMWGKVKTVLQMLTVLFYYFAAALAGPADVMAVGLITQILCWLCGAATVLSGGIYLWQNRKLFMQAKYITSSSTAIGRTFSSIRSGFLSMKPTVCRKAPGAMYMPMRNIQPVISRSSSHVNLL